MARLFTLKDARLLSARRQAYALIIFGLICLLLAWLVPSINNISSGVLVLGLGMTIAAMLHPQRLIIASSLTTLLGLEVYLIFTHIIPGNQVLSTFILAIGLALLAISLAARRGYVGKGAVSPAIIVLLVGLIEYALPAHLTPPNFIPFMLSLWLPGIGLLLLGIIYLFSQTRGYK